MCRALICTGCRGSCTTAAAGAGAGAPPLCSNARRREAAVPARGPPIWMAPPASVVMGGMGTCAGETYFICFLSSFCYIFILLLQYFEHCALQLVLSLLRA